MKRTPSPEREEEMNSSEQAKQSASASGADSEDALAGLQAEGITEALKELDTSSLTTKADLKDLELRLYKYETR